MDIWHATWRLLESGKLTEAESKLTLYPRLLTAYHFDRLLIHDCIRIKDDTACYAACELLLRKCSPSDFLSINHTHTPLLWFICHHKTVMNLDLIKLFVSYGVDVNASDNDGDTCLMFVCRQYGLFDIEFVKYLICIGADVNIQTLNDKTTCLGYSISKNETTLFSILLRNGAKMFAWPGIIMVDTMFRQGRFMKMFTSYVKMIVCSTKYVSRLGTGSLFKLLSMDIIRNLCNYL